jgi:hypothetical protein
LRCVDDQTFHDEIEGYCGQLSYSAGDTINIHVSTHASMFDVSVERRGATRDEVWSTHSVSGVFHSPPADADSEGCGWPVAASVDVDPAWMSGFYLVTLTARGVPADRSVAHACFVVRGPELVEARRRILYVLPTNTWNAYNTWGGKSLYTGGSKVSFARPFCRGMLSRPEVDRDDRKSRPVRFRETPDADGEIFQRYRTEHNYPSAIGSTGWFTHGRRFVEWAEGAGYEFDYAITSDLENDPSTLEGYDMVLLVGHDEYWSAPARAAVERHVERGGNLASFSGNTMFWQVRLDVGERGTSMVCHKYRAHLDDAVMGTNDEGAMSGMWADPVVAKPEWTLLGGGSAFGLYHRFGNATAQGVGGFLVYRGDHWLLADTGLRYGDVLGRDDGVVGYETLGCPVTFDEANLPVVAQQSDLVPMPADCEIVAVTPSSNLGVGDYPKSIAALSDQGDLEFVADRIFGGSDEAALARARFGNAVMLTCRPFGNEGGEVITIGTTDWVFGLAEDRNVAQVTANVLDRLGAS